MKELTRETTLPVQEGTELPGKRILFVCTGNTCRSPMCAALFNDRYAGLTAQAESAGLAADGSPITPEAAEALREAGIRSFGRNDYRSHRSRTVTQTDVERADRIVGVTASHAFRLMLLFPQAASKITSLPLEIADPYGGSLDEYRQCLKQIDEALRNLFEEGDAV